MATRKTTPASRAPLKVETLKHADDKRKNIPTAEFQSVVQREHQQPTPKPGNRLTATPHARSASLCRGESR